MKGIDISNWQKGIDLTKIDADFIIVKATEGTGYVDPCCDGFFQKAKSLNKCLGFYHFARPCNDAVKEADYFYRNTKNYFKEAIPILDWEVEPKGNVSWVLTWLNRIYELSGLKPLIYMSESVVNAYDWSSVVAGDYGLWVAKYRDSAIDKNYNMSNAGTLPSVKWWKSYAMWQWTSSGRLDGYSGNLDCNEFYGDKEAWDKYAGKEGISMATFIEGYQKLNWSGAEVHVYKQKSNQKLMMKSAVQAGKDPYLAVQDIADLAKDTDCAVNCNYFEMENQSIYGTHYGVEFSDINEFAPKQKEWLVAWEDLTGKMNWSESSDFWLTKAYAPVAFSPAIINIADNIKNFQYSPASGISKFTTSNTQTLLMQDANGIFSFAVFAGKVTGQQCTDFAKAYGQTFCCMLDSGGSSQMVAGGEKKVYTGRKLPNVLAFIQATEEKEEDTDQEKEQDESVPDTSDKTETPSESDSEASGSADSNTGTNTNTDKENSTEETGEDQDENKQDPEPEPDEETKFDLWKWIIELFKKLFGGK